MYGIIRFEEACPIIGQFENKIYYASSNGYQGKQD